MASRFVGISCCFFVLCFIFNSHAADSDFPHISDIQLLFYQTEVQVTDRSLDVTSQATEYYDNTGDRGRLDVLVDGLKTSTYYFNNTYEILELKGNNTCEAWGEDESIRFYEPEFYGWLSKNPLIIGPSAPLWYAQNYRDKIVSLGKATVRDIQCDAYKLNILGSKDNVDLTFYFAAKGWTTPYNVPGYRVPIRIIAEGMSSEDVEDIDMRAIVNVTTDFLYFRPTLTDWLVFQPPIGLGCPLRKPTKIMPSLPKVFTFSAEVFNALDLGTEGHADVDINFLQMWYDQNRKIARYDSYTIAGFNSSLLDFNAGVSYTQANDRTCKINSLRGSFFESTDSKLVGHMKEPEELLKLDDEYYYMGKRRVRGIPADSFERVYEDAEYMDTILKKLVVTVYFSTENIAISIDGETETRIPIYYILTGYNSTNDVVANWHYNIFEFDDVIWPEMYTTFQLDRCFPSMNEKSYFILIMTASPGLAAKLEENDDEFLGELLTKIMEITEVMEMRIPLLRADYKSTGVYVTGVMLERAPALKQFWLEFEGDIKTKDNFKVIAEANTREKCAVACVDEETFTCLGFYYCGEVCFLKHESPFEPDISDKNSTTMGEICQTWLRSTRDSSNKREPYLVDALRKLEEAVLNQEVKIEMTIKEGMTAEVPVEQIVIGDGPYTGIGGENLPYDEVVTSAKLNADDQTTETAADVQNIGDCYKACMDSKVINCDSFSFCKDADNKQCFISSVVITDRKNNSNDIANDPKCSVYSIKYKDMYEEYPGHMTIISGEDVYKPVKSVEACAKICKKETEFTCRGFEFCRSKQTCVLHSKHILDLERSKFPNSTCTHYAEKHTKDYRFMGYTLVDDDSDKRSELSLEECAKICSEELKDKCKSFNFCPPSDDQSTDSTCSLSTKVVEDAKLTAKGKCRHYEKLPNTDDWLKNAKFPKKGIPSIGYTSKGFTGLVIGMLALGLILGAMCFVLYSYYRSKSAGDGMSVRFMRQST